MEIRVRVQRGKFNWLDSSQVSINVFIKIGKRRVNLNFDEGEGRWFDVDDWSVYIPEALEAWLKETWISTQKHDVKVMLRWVGTETGQITLHNAYVRHTKEEILKETMRLTGRISNLLDEFGDLEEW